MRNRSLWLEAPAPDGSFCLTAIPKGMPVGAPGKTGTPPQSIGEQLGQSIVNKIEKAKASGSVGTFDFVLFEGSPKAEENYRGAGQ